MNGKRALIQLHHDELAAPLNGLDGSSREAHSQGFAISRSYMFR